MKSWKTILAYIMLAALIPVSCARMGNPDGGWYDETPPRIVSSSPADQTVGVKSRKVIINFNEYIKIDNPSEKVVVSPPQLEAPEIKGEGKRIVVKLEDSLKQNTTYTIDFSDAISDNNEGNPLGNYTYSFSTGDHIDTLEVAGYVVNAEDLEPIKGILVGLQSDLSDSAFLTKPLLRVSRTDSRGRFVVKGVAPGNYRVFALQDVDGDYRYTQPSEKIGFMKTTVTPSFMPDFRQDTLWTDSLHIRDIVRTGYTHFLPDDVTLRAFTPLQTLRYFVKATRDMPERITVCFTYGHDSLPVIHPLNFDGRNAFVVEANQMQDTIYYWLRDTALVNQDTLKLAMDYWANDTAGVMQLQTDTLSLLPKIPYARRLKLLEKKHEDWQKAQNRRRKRNLPVDSIMPPDPLEVSYGIGNTLDPDQNIAINFKSPIANVDSSHIHLYAKQDSLWYRAKFLFGQKPDKMLNYTLISDWRPGLEYSLEIDSAAFSDIYGKLNSPIKRGFRVKDTEEYSSLFITLTGMEKDSCVLQLLNKSGSVMKETTATDGNAEIYYITPDTYYLRMYVDSNGNGKWDTGDYSRGEEPEPLYYYPEKIECRAKWDVNKTWDPTLVPLYRQKPSAITKQKAEATKQVKNRNAERARRLGKEYIAN